MSAIEHSGEIVWLVGIGYSDCETCGSTEESIEVTVDLDERTIRGAIRWGCFGGKASLGAVETCALLDEAAELDPALAADMARIAYGLGVVKDTFGISG